MFEVDRSKAYWNLIRGICIVCVIIIHLTVPLNSEGYPRFGWYLLRRAIAFPVAVFFFMSGYFVRLEKVKDKKYIWSKFKRVFFPYFGFSIFYIVENYILGSKTNLNGVIASLTFGVSEIQMYFLLYLMQMILLLPIVRRMISSNKRDIWLFLTFCVSISFSLIKQLANDSTQLLAPFCIPFICFYILGAYIRGWENKLFDNLIFVKKPWSCKCNLFILIGSLCLCILIGMISKNKYDTSQVMLCNYLYCIAIIMAFYALYLKIDKTKVFCKPLVWIGENSFTIYLIHMIPMRLLIIFFDQTKITFPIEQICIFVGTVVFCIAICVVCQYIKKVHRQFKGVCK